MRSKIPKIISGIVAAISIAVLAWLELPPVWFWIGFEVLAALLVAVGCIGELYLFHHPAGRRTREKNERHKFESRFILAVAVGVTMEVLALSHAIPEAIKLENDVASANERASTNEVQVEQLKLELAHANIKLAEIKMAIPPRQIPEKQRELFISTLLQATNSGSPKIDIKVFVQEGEDFEANNFADSVRNMLNDAGYGTNREKVIKIPPFSVSLGADSKNARMPPIFAIYAIDNDGKKIPLSMPSFGGNLTPFFPTKATVQEELKNPQIPTLAYYSRLPNDILGGVCNIMRYIGFPPVELAMPGLLNPGEVAFYIPPQVQ